MASAPLKLTGPRTGAFLATGFSEADGLGPIEASSTWRPAARSATCFPRPMASAPLKPERSPAYQRAILSFSEADGLGPIEA